MIIEDISQINIYFKDGDNTTEKVNEVAIFQPLEKKAHFDETKPVKERKWTFYDALPFHQKALVKVQTFFFHRFKRLIPPERRTPEAQFKTVLAILLVQEPLREYFLGSEKSQRQFLSVIEQAAREWGQIDFPIPSRLPLPHYELAKQLTTLTGKTSSLLEDRIELNLQMATLSKTVRNEILFSILNRVDRPLLTSVLEIVQKEKNFQIELSTRFAQVHVKKIDTHTNQILYTYVENRATSSIRTQRNIQSGVKGVINQRLIKDKNLKIVGAYSGAISTPENVLEQILFLLYEDKGPLTECFLSDQLESHTFPIYPLLFISLYSWDEWELLIAEHRAIEKLDGKCLTIKTATGQEFAFQLRLFHTNIPFNALSRYPSPAEVSAKMGDFHEEWLLYLTGEVLQLLHISPPPAFAKLQASLKQIRQEKDFITREQKWLNAMDNFHKLKKELIQTLNGQTLEEKSLRMLLSHRDDSGRHLDGIDEYVYTRYLTRKLNWTSTTNCRNSTDRSAGADAADKAQYVFETSLNKPFLPAFSSLHEVDFFKVLYSMYLVWEEPELTAGLSTGFVGEKFHTFLQKNPETTRYLIRWLKKHPEIYTALSDYR